MTPDRSRRAHPGAPPRRNGGRPPTMVILRRWLVAVTALVLVILVVVSLTSGGPGKSASARGDPADRGSGSGGLVDHGDSLGRTTSTTSNAALPGMPPVLDPQNIYSADSPTISAPPSAGAIPDDLRAQQRVGHGHGDRSEHVPGRCASSARRPAPARRSVLGPQDALGHQRRGQQPDAHRTAKTGLPGDTGAGRRPVQHVLHARRQVTPSSSPRAKQRLDFRNPQTMKLKHSLQGAVRRRRPHGLLGKRAVSGRHLRVRGSAW